MKRAWVLAPVLAALTACGTLGTPPAPTTGDLLGAPTLLQLGPQRLKAEAVAQLGGGALRVRVRVQGQRGAEALPPLAVTSVYVVTREGVWSAPAARASRQGCGELPCLQTSGSGAAGRLTAGEGVQVVVGLEDPRGRVLWLRDARVTIQGE
ncbi:MULTISPECIES: hypothetical protein [Deinococcus]|uniref:hypothetical protein n=1 Tax=Deinococcus TaxID=1298 RepID=UPI000489B6D2|nr:MULTISPECIES: hypothetical protein [Deinococcus]KEF33683.1 hypothetical protein RDMS_10840 [Deinococcus sp. RL]